MRWTRKGIIEEIRRLHAAGEELNYKTVEENHLNLVRAASWHFGTWKRAIEKAGLDYDDVSKYQKWSRERVVERIQELYRQGKDLSWRSISTEVDPPLAAAALRENSGFESWFEAITAAGLNHDEIARYRRWTRERVLEEILDRNKNGLPMSSIAVQRQNSPLYCAAKRRFLQWDSALAAAGLDPNKIRIRKAPDTPKPRRRRGDSGQLVMPEMESPVPLSLVRPARRRRNSDIPTLEEAVAMAKPAPKKGRATKTPPPPPEQLPAKRGRKPAVATTTALQASAEPVVPARKVTKAAVVSTPEPAVAKSAPKRAAKTAAPASKSKTAKAPEPVVAAPKTPAKSRSTKPAEPVVEAPKPAAKTKAVKAPEPVTAPAKASKPKVTKTPEVIAVPAKAEAKSKAVKAKVEPEPAAKEAVKPKKAKGKEKEKAKDKPKSKKKK